MKTFSAWFKRPHNPTPFYLQAYVRHDDPDAVMLRSTGFCAQLTMVEARNLANFLLEVVREWTDNGMGGRYEQQES